MSKKEEQPVKAPKIRLEKPKVKSVRVRVQEMEGRKATNTKGMTVYGATVDEIFAYLEAKLKELV